MEKFITQIEYAKNFIPDVLKYRQSNIKGNDPKRTYDLIGYNPCGPV